MDFLTYKRRKGILSPFPFLLCFSWAPNSKLHLDFQQEAVNWARRDCKPALLNPPEKQPCLGNSSAGTHQHSCWPPKWRTSHPADAYLGISESREGTVASFFIFALYSVLEVTTSSPWASQGISTDSRTKWGLPFLSGLTNSMMYNRIVSPLQWEALMSAESFFPCLSVCWISLSLSVLSVEFLCLSLLISNSHSSQKNSRWPSGLLNTGSLLLLISTHRPENVPFQMSSQSIGTSIIFCLQKFVATDRTPINGLWIFSQLE